MRFLYIGQYAEGSTSRMRGESLKAILKPETFEVIDTLVPFYESHPIFRSLAFRFKKGPVLSRTNGYIINNISGKYDVVWVDKAVFISPQVTQQLRAVAGILIHYTPDTAFEGNRSGYFFKSIHYYDYVITTKSFEKSAYLKYLPEYKVLYIPQGFDKKTHFPRHLFEDKKNEVVFIGLFEPSRAAVVRLLLENGIPVVLAGFNWEKFAADHRDFPLTYLGKSLFKEDYATAISGARFGLGLVSKRFPELHTTRTFEIPACGTALITEHNRETSAFFEEDEAIFYRNPSEMVDKIKYYGDHLEALKLLTQKGYKKVTSGHFDYENQLSMICDSIGISTRSLK